MIVMKFGGTSVGSPERIRATADIVRSQAEKKPIVVVSAVGGITDELLEAARKAFEEGKVDISEIEEQHLSIIRELGLDETLLENQLCELKEILEVITKIKDDDAKVMDIVVSFGERMSSRILAEYMKNNGINARQFDAWDVGFITDSEFGSAELLEESYDRIRQGFSNVECIPIVTGFIAKNKKGQITTLGRGGSDYTAAIIGAAISANEIQIWTDVDGIMTTDPRIVPEAKSLENITFSEAAESAFFGAKVLHPKTIIPAVSKNIPVKVLNSFNPEHKGTTILKECEECKGVVRTISIKRDVIVFNINSSRMLLAHGFLAKLFEVFNKYKIPVDMLATSEVSVSLTVDNGKNFEQIEKIKEEISEFAEVTVEKDKTIICLVGSGMKERVGVISRIFKTVAENNINIEMLSQGASRINVGFVVDGKDTEAAVQTLHKEFFG